jgi:SAM-dependent methyltransferase
LRADHRVKRIRALDDAARYDRAYFDRWYRHADRRVRSPAALRREVACVVGIAELVLGRAVRSVLDVGCGEGLWHAPLHRLRPSIRYTGVDPSPYVVSRFGTRRQIRAGTIDGLDAAGVGGAFDLIVCAGVLNYVAPAALRRGLAQIAERLHGVAYLELYTATDAVRGDTRPAMRRSAAWYRRALADAGFVSCGLHCYVGASHADALTALERA